MGRWILGQAADRAIFQITIFRACRDGKRLSGDRHSKPGRTRPLSGVEESRAEAENQVNEPYGRVPGALEQLTSRLRSGQPSVSPASAIPVGAKNVAASMQAKALLLHPEAQAPGNDIASVESTSSERTDAEAIRVEDAGIVPQDIYGLEGHLIPVGQAGKARIGNYLCYSGAKTTVPQCGPVVARSTRWIGASDGIARGGYWVEFNEPPAHGDSGAPVWSPEYQSRNASEVVVAERGSETLVEPLLHPYRMPPNVVPGILDDPLMRPLSLKQDG